MPARAILMVGCRPQLLRAARDGGFPVVVISGPWEKDWILPQQAYAEKILLVDDPARVDQVLSALARAGIGGGDLRAVCPASDDYVLAAAVLAELLGVEQGPHPLDALCWKDKSLQKQAMAAAGVRVAAHQVIDDVLDDLPDSFDVSFPAVLKPIAGAGTSHTYIVRNDDELRAAVGRLPRTLPFRTFLLEEFVVGNELHVDGILCDGELMFLSIGRYHHNLVNASSGALIASTIVDPVEESGLYEQVREFAQRALSALSVTASVFHMEIFHNADGGLTFGECGIRLPGVFIPQMVKRKFGVDLARVQLELLSGTRPRLEVTPTRKAVSMVLLPTIAGTLLSCPSEAEITAQPGVAYAEVQKPVGAVLRSKEDVPTARVGEVLLVTDDAASARDRIAALVDWFTHRLVVAAEPPSSNAPIFRLWREHHGHPLSAA